MDRKNWDLTLIGSWAIITALWQLVEILWTVKTFNNLLQDLDLAELIFSGIWFSIGIVFVILLLYGGIQLIRIRRTGLITLKIMLIVQLALSIFTIFTSGKIFLKYFNFMMLLNLIWGLVLPLVFAIYLFTERVQNKFAK